jgi:hypothetical protein
VLEKFMVEYSHLALFCAPAHFAHGFRAWIWPMAGTVYLNLVVCGLANDHSDKIANPKPLRKMRPNDCNVRDLDRVEVGHHVVVGHIKFFETRRAHNNDATNSHQIRKRAGAH